MVHPAAAQPAPGAVPAQRGGHPHVERRQPRRLATAVGLDRAQRIVSRGWFVAGVREAGVTPSAGGVAHTHATAGGAGGLLVGRNRARSGAATQPVTVGRAVLPAHRALHRPLSGGVRIVRSGQGQWGALCPGAGRWRAVAQCRREPCQRPRHAQCPPGACQLWRPFCKTDCRADRHASAAGYRTRLPPDVAG
ncbi:hypothetical protein D3C79_831880 [compost metagenome]